MGGRRGGGCGARERHGRRGGGLVGGGRERGAGKGSALLALGKVIRCRSANFQRP